MEKLAHGVRCFGVPQHDSFRSVLNRADSCKICPRRVLMPRANARSGGVSMVRHISAVLLLAALLPLTGCRSAPRMKPSTPAPQPASADRVDQIRRMYQEHNPDIRVGLV